MSLAFDRPGSAGTITAADSVVLWDIVRQMKRDLGRPLFRPATRAAFTTPDTTGYTRGVVLVAIDLSLGPTRGYTNWIWAASQDVIAARTRFGSPASVASSASVADAAGFALAYQVRGAQVGVGPTTGLAEALAGELRFELAWSRPRVFRGEAVREAGAHWRRGAGR